MIHGIFHPGSGLGNQLHRYVATRVVAERLEAPFSMVGPENFKGHSFMKLDMGVKSDDPRDLSLIPYQVEMPAGKCIPISDLPLWEEQTPYYNPEFNFIEDNTVIDGDFQDERYFEHYLDEVSRWLNVEPVEILEDTCVIGFRGGEFSLFPDLFLTKEYWDEAIEMMRKKGIKNFEVHTDDAPLAQQFFPDFKVIHDIGINWRSMRYARHAVVANSSFFILPRLLAHHEMTPNPDIYQLNEAITIAPRYWGRRNTKTWQLPQNYYKSFTYL